MKPRYSDLVKKKEMTGEEAIARRDSYLGEKLQRIFDASLTHVAGHAQRWGRSPELVALWDMKDDAFPIAQEIGAPQKVVEDWIENKMRTLGLTEKRPAGQPKTWRTVGGKPEKLTMEELKGYLSEFIGTTQYYSHFTGLLYTDGVKAMAEKAGAYWLIDVVASWQPHKIDHQGMYGFHKQVRDMDWQLWTLTVNPDKTAEVTMREDTDKPVIVRQKLEYTDFPVGEFKLYVEGPPNKLVLLLPSEH